MTTPHPIQLFFSSHHPLAGKMEASFEGSTGGTVKVEITASPDLVHDRENATLHSGFATIVLDSIMGGAVMGTLRELQPIATIGLSVHHLRRPVAGEKLKGSAVCSSTHNDVAYVTGSLMGEDGETVAIASGTFMIGTRGTSIRTRGEGRPESRI